MKKSMTEYMSTLSENNMDILENIIQHKYRKFIALYWMLRDYSDYLVSLKYKETNHDSLKIEFRVANININDVVNGLLSSVDDSVQVDVKKGKNSITLDIQKEEVN